MATYRRINRFGHLRADCRGPGSALEPYARFEHGTTYVKLDKQSASKPNIISKSDIFQNSLCTGSQKDITREEDLRTHEDETRTKKYKTMG